jgi:hypothetical protein
VQFSIWTNETEEEFTLLQGHQPMDIDDKWVKDIEAGTWDDARTMYYEFLNTLPVKE